MSTKRRHASLFFLQKRPYSSFSSLILLIAQVIVLLPGLNLFLPTEATPTSLRGSNISGLTAGTPQASPQVQTTTFFEKNPLSFESNQGQFDRQVKFQARSPG